MTSIGWKCLVSLSADEVHWAIRATQIQGDEKDELPRMWKERCQR